MKYFCAGKQLSKNCITGASPCVWQLNKKCIENNKQTIIPNT